jgi:hypothetical protein
MTCSLKILRLKPCGTCSLLLYLQHMRAVLLDVEFPAFGYLKSQPAVCTYSSHCWRSVSSYFVMAQPFFGSDTHLMSPDELSKVWLKISVSSCWLQLLQCTQTEGAAAGAAHGMPADVRVTLNTRKSQECKEWWNELTDLYWSYPLLFIYWLKLCICFLYLLCSTHHNLHFITLLIYSGYSYNV